MATTFVATILLLFPNSISILCIEADGNVRIEDINAGCCAGFAGPIQSKDLPLSRLAGLESCLNCTDFLMATGGIGAMPVVREDVPPGLSADEPSSLYVPHDIFSALRRWGMHKKLSGLGPPLSFAPLRC